MPTFLGGQKAGRLFLDGQDVAKAYAAGELIFAKPGPTPGPPNPGVPPTYELDVDGSIGEDYLAYTNGLLVPLDVSGGGNPAGAYDGALVPGDVGTGNPGWPASYFTTTFPSPVSQVDEIVMKAHFEQPRAYGSGSPNLYTTNAYLYLQSSQMESRIEKPPSGYDVAGDYRIKLSGWTGSYNPAEYQSGSGPFADVVTMHHKPGEFTRIWLGGVMVSEESASAYSGDPDFTIFVGLYGNSDLLTSELPRLYSHQIWILGT